MARPIPVTHHLPTDMHIIDMTDLVSTISLFLKHLEHRAKNNVKMFWHMPPHHCLRGLLTIDKEMFVSSHRHAALKLDHFTCWKHLDLWIDGRSHEKSGGRSFQTEEPEAFKAVAWFPRDVPRLQIHTISLFPVLEPKRIQIASAKSWHWIDLAFRCERRLQTCTYFSFFCSSLRWV